MAFKGDRVRVLVIPGLHGSGPAHWQTWLQLRFPRAVRVEQRDWSVPDLERWSARIGEVVESEACASWIAVAHSFGCLALARHLGQQPVLHGDTGGPRIAAALLVAPAEPARFGIADEVPQTSLGVPSLLLASDTDPWMSAARAAHWAHCWGASFVNLGDAGHINADSGFGPMPRALRLTESLMRHVAQSARAPGHKQMTRRTYSAAA